MKQILSVFSMPKSSLLCMFLRSIFMVAVIIVINWLIPIDCSERNAVELYNGMRNSIFLQPIIVISVLVALRIIQIKLFHGIRYMKTNAE